MHIFIDLEMNQWKKKREEELSSEIIEVGAVKMNKKFEVVDLFSQKIQPDLCLILSTYIAQLTGITQEDLRTSPSFYEVFPIFEEWIGKADEIIGVYAWGKFDSYQIKEECRVKHYSGKILDLIETKFVDFQAVFENHCYMKSNSMGLKKAVELLELHFSGRNHCAVDDALNLARVFKEFHQNKAKVKEIKAAYKIKRKVEIEEKRKNKIISSIQKDLEMIIQKYGNKNIVEMEPYFAWISSAVTELDELKKK